MDTVEEVARSVLGAVATDAGHTLAARWVVDRYIEMVSKVHYRHLRRLGEVVVPATQQSGTVTLTQGSRLVVPDATALAAWNTPGPMTDLVQRSLRGSLQNTWYMIAGIDGTMLVLETPYQSATTAGAGYQIVAQRVALAPDVRWMSEIMMLQRTWQPIVNAPMDVLNRTAPARSWATSWPQVWCETERSADGTKRVEFYPYPSQNEVVHYVFWSLPLDLGFDSPLPKEIDGRVLKEGALIDAMRYKMAQEANAGKVELAAFWRNEYRAQETRWSEVMRDAARTDRGVDDVTFILSMRGGGGYGAGGVLDFPTTAYDVVLGRLAGLGV